MAADEQKSPVNVNLEASAKLEVKAEVPQSVMERGGHMLLDVLAPFTESRGLKADLVRLQREEVAVQVAEFARKQLEDNGQVPRAIPLRTFVPLIERASLEDPDSELVELWGNLLASASSSDDQDTIDRMVNVLGQVGGDEAALLKKFGRDALANYRMYVQTDDADIINYDRWKSDVGRIYADRFERQFFDNLKDIGLLTDGYDEQALPELCFSGPCFGGCTVTRARLPMVLSVKGGTILYKTYTNPEIGNKERMVVALSSLGLIDVHQISVDAKIKALGWLAQIDIEIVQLTSFGIKFLGRCEGKELDNVQ